MGLVQFPRSCPVHIGQRHAVALAVAIDITGVVPLHPYHGSRKTRAVLQHNDEKRGWRVAGALPRIGLHVLDGRMNWFRRRDRKGGLLDQHHIVHDRRSLRIRRGVSVPAKAISVAERELAAVRTRRRPRVRPNRAQRWQTGAQSRRKIAILRGGGNCHQPDEIQSQECAHSLSPASIIARLEELTSGYIRSGFCGPQVANEFAWSSEPSLPGCSS